MTLGTYTGTTYWHNQDIYAYISRHVRIHIKTCTHKYQDIHAYISQARIWDVTSGACISELRGHVHVVESVCFSNAEADVVLLACVHGANRSNADLQGVNGSEDTCGVDNLSKQGVGMNGVEGSKTIRKVDGGGFLVTAGRDKSIRVWQVSTSS